MNARNMRFGRITTIAASICVSIWLVGCEVDQTEEGEMPDVEVEGGNMPEYDVRGPDVDVGTKEKTVTVPTVDVDMPEDRDATDE